MEEYTGAHAIGYVVNVGVMKPVIKAGSDGYVDAAWELKERIHHKENVLKYAMTEVDPSIPRPSQVPAHSFDHADDCGVLHSNGGVRAVGDARTPTGPPRRVGWIWPGAIALARILVASGTVDVLGHLLGQYLAVGFVGVVAVSVVTVLTTNLTTNTAAAVALVIGITAKAGLPVAGFVYVVAGMVNISYALPSSNGCLAVTTGFGANVSTLLRHGAVLCVLNTVVAVVYFVLAMEFVPGWTLP